jgi:predicted protein tyrosine phosphatase
MRGRNVLFICSRNRWRSLTAEKIFERLDGIQVRSAGTEPGARIRVTAGHLSWADLIFVMEKKHLRRLQDKFHEDIAGKKVICLNIADDYEFMQPELVDLLEADVMPHLNA